MHTHHNMNNLVASAIVTSVVVNCTATVTQLGNTLWQQFWRYWYKSKSKCFLISRANCMDIFIGLTAFISQFSKSIPYQTLISIDLNNNMNWNWLDQNTSQKKRVFAVPEPNTFLEFTVNGITFEVLPISPDNSTIQAYQIGTRLENNNALSALLAPIMIGMGIDEDSVKAILPINAIPPISISIDVEGIEEHIHND